MNNKQVLVGSQATLYYFPDFRQPKDRDYLVDGAEKSKKGFEYKDANKGDGLKYLYNNSNFCFDDLHHCYIASPEFLYTLKLSHSFWNIHWEKTAFDILFFQKKGVQHDEHLFDLLYKDWEKIHGKKRAYLKKSNDEFFKDNVEREYIHDDLHKAVAYYDAPLYERCKKDINSALLDKALFNAMPEDDKIKLCREEIYVTALERWLIPTGFRTDVKVAYRRAIKQLVTSMTKGFFPKYIMLNYSKICELDDHNFVELFKNNQHKIRKIEVAYE